MPMWGRSVGRLVGEGLVTAKLLFSEALSKHPPCKKSAVACEVSTGSSEAALISKLAVSSLGFFSILDNKLCSPSLALNFEVSV